MRHLRTSCRHFTGVGRSETCAAGIRYDSVRDSTHPGPYRWPCLGADMRLGEGCTTTCVKHELLSKEEAEAEEAEIEAVVSAHLAKLAANICPACDTPYTDTKQIGPCLYAIPCGHRLGQGRKR